jgi:hypothetical protein
MNNTNNSSSLIGKLIPFIIVLIGLVGLYYLYQYLFGAKTSNSYVLLSGKHLANIDSSKPITVTSDKLPAIYEGGEFTVSSWLYINNWSYRSGFNKSILNIGGPNFDTIRIYLGGTKPKLHVRLQTKDRSAVNSTTSAPPSASNQVPIESLDKGTQNATFNILQMDSGLLDSSPLCDLPELELQRWINITVAVNGRTVDVYFDGKLARSCVLPSFYKVDAGGYSANLLAYGGFGGEIATVTLWDSALNPETVYKNYMAGPEPVTNLGSWLSSFFAPGIDISISSKQ